MVEQQNQFENCTIIDEIYNICYNLQKLMQFKICHNISFARKAINYVINAQGKFPTISIVLMYQITIHIYICICLI